MSARNLLTDIAGVSVGHADDAALASGVTAIIFDKPAVASIDVRGGGPGTREDALLDPVSTVDAIDAITLAGGSAFGLEAGGGVQALLAEQGRGFRIRHQGRNDQAERDPSDRSHEHNCEINPKHPADLQNEIADQDEQNALNQREYTEGQSLGDYVIRQADIEVALPL